MKDICSGFSFVNGTLLSCASLPGFLKTDEKANSVDRSLILSSLSNKYYCLLSVSMVCARARVLLGGRTEVKMLLPFLKECTVSYIYIHTHICLATQSGLTLCDLTDCRPPGSFVHGIFQAKLEWIAISCSRGSS